MLCHRQRRRLLRNGIQRGILLPNLGRPRQWHERTSGLPWTQTASSSMAQMYTVTAMMTGR
eukprot:1393323-Pyramimonas_sp.AAC.1